MVSSLISIPVLFSVASIIGESNIFGIGGIIYYSWVIYFAILVALISLLFCLNAKKRNYRYKKNMIVSLIVIPFSVIFGSYRFVFNGSFDFMNQIVINANFKTSVEIPICNKTVTQKEERYLLGNVKISSNKESFESSMDYRWTFSLSLSIKNVLLNEVSFQTASFDYFLFYDNDNKNFNEVVQQENGHFCTFLAYQKKSGRLMILDEHLYQV